MTDLPLDSAPHGRDWRLRLSLAFTVVWVLLGIIYISSVVGWTDFARQNAPALGGFLEGAFAPLAFLWLVVGFFLQQQQLHQNTETIRAQLVEMRRTAEQSEIQSRAIAADELHSRQDTFLRVVDVVNEQLGVIGGYLFMSWGMGDAIEDALQLWGSLGHGDPGAFSRRIVRLCYSGEEQPGVFFWGTDVRRRHSENFVAIFDRLLRHAERCDPDAIIADALRDGMHGRVYRFIQECRPEAGEATSA